ncbi:MAG: hypothetical protein KBT13_10730 [Bacteroidales bacterium]|nr:hypothetical protein [Candidatus Sodaliphilus limicaballi]
MQHKVKDIIIDLLKGTGREGIENVIAYMTHDDVFFKKHCHSHHLYMGGLADHSLQTLKMAIAKRDKYESRFPHAVKVGQESLVLCSLLHDICDCEPQFRRHGSLSIEILDRLGLVLSSEERDAISKHMHDPRLSFKLDHKSLRYRLRKYIYSADKKSARKFKGYY